MYPTTYLCGPINGCTDEECNDWRDRVNRLLLGPTINPMRRDYRGIEGDHTKDLVELDKYDVQRSDVILASWEASNRSSAGTPMEILFAWTLGKVVVLVMPEDMTPSPWLVYHATRIFTSYEEACAFINFRLG